MSPSSTFCLADTGVRPTHGENHRTVPYQEPRTRIHIVHLTALLCNLLCAAQRPFHTRRCLQDTAWEREAEVLYNSVVHIQILVLSSGHALPGHWRSSGQCDKNKLDSNVLAPGSRSDKNKPTRNRHHAEASKVPFCLGQFHLFLTQYASLKLASVDALATGKRQRHHVLHPRGKHEAGGRLAPPTRPGPSKRRRPAAHSTAGGRVRVAR